MTDTQYSSFRWYIFFTMIIVTATTSMALIAPASVMPILFTEMQGVEPGQVTFVTMGIFNFFLAAAALLGGYLLDKLGVIKVFIGGLLLIMIGAFLMPIVGATYWGMLFIRLLQGFGTGPVMAASMASCPPAFRPHSKTPQIITAAIANAAIRATLCCRGGLARTTRGAFICFPAGRHWSNGALWPYLSLCAFPGRDRGQGGGPFGNANLPSSCRARR